MQLPFFPFLSHFFLIQLINIWILILIQNIHIPQLLMPSGMTHRIYQVKIDLLQKGLIGGQNCYFCKLRGPKVRLNLYYIGPTLMTEKNRGSYIISSLAYSTYNYNKIIVESYNKKIIHQETQLREPSFFQHVTIS